MTLRLWNTKTRRLDPVAPREGPFRMYVCGPTVYDRSHIGHGRSYVFYDALRRHLEASGVDVWHVQNFTDVEESIARRAREAGVSPLAWADRHVEAFLADMDALLVRRAHAYPRVTEHVPRIVEVIEDLVARDVAYTIECVEDECNVYFDASRVEDYGALIGHTLEEVSASGAEHAGERRQAADFALWKSRADWGVTWPSPWGEGRPGWHVECAVMVEAHLGTPFDLHGGGLDLVFPHHESERAVAEAAWGRGYCDLFVHNGFVTVEERKMSKSKGNFVYLSDVVAAHGAEATRTWLLSARYRDPLAYSNDAVAEAGRRLERWRAGAARARAAPERAEAAGFEAEFVAALDDDFDTVRAFEVLDKLSESGLGCASAFRRAADVLGLPSLAR